MIKLAQGVNTTIPDEIGGWTWPQTNLPTTIAEIGVTAYNWIFGFMGAFALLAIVYSGVLYMLSAGDSAKAEAAKKNLTWAIVGFLLIAFSAMIVNLVQTIIT